MLRKIFALTALLTLLLTACAQATEAPYSATVPPTKSSDNADTTEATPYPQPNSAQAALPTSDAYPDPGESPAQADETQQNLALEKGLNTDFAPQESDLDLAVGPAYLELESSKATPDTEDSSKMVLHLVGNLPNPCYQLRVLVREPDEQGHLNVVVYSVASTEKVCADVLQPFDETITLDTLAAGKYSVYINETELGQLELK